MIREDWFKFKSGSDIRGVAYEGGDKPVDLTDETVSAICSAFLLWMQRRLLKERVCVAVGHDPRLSAPRLMRCVTETLKRHGARVIDTGLSSTPAMFMITLSEFGADASVQITASHHPFDKNGLKFFTREGGLEGSQISEILGLAAGGEKPKIAAGCIETLDFMSRYSANLVDFVREKTGERQPLCGMKIVVDAGNGGGGFFADRVIAPLGADCSASQFLEPDGRFPNHIPNPENAAAMESVCGAVKKARADFGIIFDTDVDRAGAVDKNGLEINRNRLIALISAILLKEKTGAAIVTDSVTSDGLADFIRAKGGRHHRYKRGYKNVIDEAIRLNREGIDAPLAIETSGHAAFRENHFLDDGAYLITRILISLANARREGKELLDLVSGLKMPVESAEVRLGFHTDDFKSYGGKVIEELKNRVESDPRMKLADSNYEGVRANCESGWFLVRMSVHDPIMPVNIECDRAGDVKIIARRLYELMKGYEGLNLTNLEKLISEDR